MIVAFFIIVMDEVEVSEGEAGDYFYIIIRGSACVSHSLGNSRINLALIQTGEYFGEWSVLTGAPCATVRQRFRQ